MKRFVVEAMCETDAMEMARRIEEHMDVLGLSFEEATRMALSERRGC